MKYILLSIFIFSTWFIYGQAESFIEGQLLDAQSKEVIRFAKIYNKTISKGAITDDEGFFSIEVYSDTDEISVSYIGYQKQSLLYSLKEKNKVYFLNQKIQLIDAVMISPKDLPYLYELIFTCKKVGSFLQSGGKGVYELKSFMEGDQIELVEGYYNFLSEGYDVERLDLKTARLGLQMKNEKMFVSLESSRAIVSQNLLTENAYFPHSPFEYSIRKMKKHYSLQLRKKYLDDNRDSIYVIDYKPRTQAAYFFEGTLWINKTKSNILKVESNCLSCKKHPFLPIFSTDSIKNLDLYITRTFREESGQMGFNHVDFKYDIRYKSRSVTSYAIDYEVKTQAVLYGYDFKNYFQLPQFQFENPNIGDYRKVNAIPYDSFFWEYNNEDKLTDRKDQNKKFMQDSSTIESRTLFSPNAFFNEGLLEHPYKKWSTNRFLFRPLKKPKTISTREQVISGVGVTGPQYNLKVRVFADINSYGDSTNILTATVFDPYESFSKLPDNTRTHCFINMYFDFYEIARLQFLSEFERQGIPNQVFHQFYQAFFTQVELDARLFLKEVERGQNEKNMLKWNAFIVQNLGIDNVGMFKPFEVNVGEN